mmetsp:Transcript_10560/g.27992  ORF Transcript_10560/g.27992 Transcript_10560/m.27992 type:complete len:631 (+) Transcript_10560:558-2450(+)
MHIRYGNNQGDSAFTCMESEANWFFPADHLKTETPLSTTLNAFVHTNNAHTFTYQVLWSSYQIISSTPDVINIKMPRPYSDFLNVIGAVTQIDVASALGGACLNPDVRKYTFRTTVTCCAVIGLLLADLLICFIRRCATKQEGLRARIYSESMFFYLLLTYCVLPVLTKYLFRGLPAACGHIPYKGTNYEEYEVRDGKVKYLTVDPATDCHSKSYEEFVVFNWAMIALCTLFLLSYAVLLRYHRDRIVKIDDESLQLRHAARYDPKLKPFQFLIRPFQREMYWYDLYDMPRRIFFVSLLPLIGSDVERAVIGCILSLVGLLISSNLKPYQKEVTNALSEALQYLIFFTFFIGVVTALDDKKVNILGGKNGDEISTVGVIAVIANLIVVFISARPGIMAMYKFKANEAKLQAAIESTMAQQSTKVGKGSSSSTRIFDDMVNLRALERAQLIDVDVSPDTITPLVARLVAKTRSWLGASDGGLDDVWLPEAITDGLEGTEEEPLLPLLPTDAADSSNRPQKAVSGSVSTKELAVAYDKYIENRMVHQRSKIAAKDNLLARTVHQRAHKYESAEDLSRVREKIRRAMLHASRDVQIVLGQVIDEFAGTRNLVKACDATIKGAVEVLSPLYEAM